MTTTVTVSIAVSQITGAALPLGRVEFTLTSADIDSAIIAPASTSVTLDANGVGTVALWPNASGSQGTQYRVTIVSASGDLQFNGLATVPASNCNLHDVLTIAAPAVVDDAQAAATAAQGYAAAASADSAVASAHIADTTAAHAASAISVSAISGRTATDVQGMLAEISAAGGGGSGTVTSVTGTAPISVATGTSTPAISISAASGAAAGSMSAADKTKLDAISGTNTGDQTITLSGDVTGSGTGSFATTIGAAKVTLAMLANMATGSLFYRKTAAAGAPEVQTLATLKTDLGLTGTNGGDQTAATVANTPAGNIAATDVQAAINELDTEKQAALGFTAENAANKDATGGYAGLTLFKLNLRNAANTITSWFTTAATVARTWTMPDKDGTVAMTSDITGTNSGTNTGDETGATIATLHHAATAKTVLVDADEVTGGDSAASFGLIRTVWSDVRTYLASKAWTWLAAHVFSDQQVSRAMLIDCGQTFVDKGNSGTTTQTLDYTAGSHQKITATGNFTIATSNWPPTGNLGAILLEGVNFGAITVTWPTINWVKPDGTTTTTFSTWLAASTGRTALQSSGTDFFKIFTRDAGTTLYGGWAV